MTEPSLCGGRPKGRGRGKDQRVKREKIGRGKIAVILTHFDFPPFLRPARQARESCKLSLKAVFT